MKKAAYTALVVFFTIIGLFILGVCIAAFQPAFANRADDAAKRATFSEMSSLVKCLYKYADVSANNQFPESLSDLNQNELKEHSIGDPALLHERYWYLPAVANKVRDYKTPILIEKPNHYSNCQGGYIAFSGFFVRWSQGDEYANIIQRYCNTLSGAKSP